MFEGHSLECNIYIVYLTTTCSHASSNKTDGFTAFVKHFKDVRQQQHISLTLSFRPEYILKIFCRGTKTITLPLYLVLFAGIA